MGRLLEDIHSVLQQLREKESVRDPYTQSPQVRGASLDAGVDTPRECGWFWGDLIGGLLVIKVESDM